METEKEYTQRLNNLQTKLRERGLDGALLIYPIDVYYFAGTRQNAVLWAPAQGEPVLLVRKSLSRARQESLLADIRPFASSRELPALLSAAGEKIGLTYDVLPVQQYNFYARLLPGKEIVDISAVIREVRSVKSPWEIARMKNSAFQMSQVFARIPDFLKPGMREIDLAAEIECRARKLGHEGYVRMRSFNQELFYGHILSGASGGYPSFFDGPAGGWGLSKAFPQGASTAEIARDVPILVDYTGIFNGYIIDMTRMFVFGRLAPHLEKAFAAALAVQQYLVENLKPGTLCADLFDGARALAEKAGFGANFMGVPGEQVKFIGHGVGLELDELPVIAQGVNAPLLAGQTVAIEPKFVFSAEGIVGIENTFVVDEKGGLRLTELDDAIVYLE